MAEINVVVAPEGFGGYWRLLEQGKPHLAGLHQAEIAADLPHIERGAGWSQGLGQLMGGLGAVLRQQVAKQVGDVPAVEQPMILMSGQPSRVVARPGPGAAARTRLINLKGWGNFPTRRSIITKIGLSHQGNFQFLRTLGGLVYRYVFGDRAGQRMKNPPGQPSGFLPR